MHILLFAMLNIGALSTSGLNICVRATARRRVPAAAVCCDGWRRRSSSSRKAELARLAQIERAAAEGTINDFECAAVNAVGGPNAATYGEITPKGFTTLALRLGLDEQCRFADLGSGTGKAVMQAASQFGVASAVGVELSSTRHERALQTLAANPSLASRVTFVEGDCAGDEAWAADGPLAGLTDVWLCSLLFNKELLERLASRIAARPTIRRVATLKVFPNGLEGFEEEPTVEPCDMSWTARLVVPDNEPSGSAVHIYRRTAVAAAAVRSSQTQTVRRIRW